MGRSGVGPPNRRNNKGKCPEAGTNEIQTISFEHLDPAIPEATCHSYEPISLSQYELGVYHLQFDNTPTYSSVWSS